ncbi:MAG: glycosyltransferase family 9 protein [Acidobacteriota bacterium]
MLASPFLRVLRAAMGPKARLDFVVRKEFAELVRTNPHISVVHEYDAATGWKGLRELNETLRREEFGLAVDLHDSLRTKYLRTCCGAARTTVVDKRQWERWQLVHRKKNLYREIIPVPLRYIETLSEFGIEDDGRGLELFIPDAIQSAVAGRLSSAGLSRFDHVIGLCPGAKHFTKRWQKEKFAETGARFALERNAKILLFGGHAETEDCAFVAEAIRRKAGEGAVLDLSGSLSLMETAAAFDFCDVVVTNDSGLMHIAAARQRRIVAIFGSTVLELGFGPFGTEAQVVERKDLACRPCTHIGRAECPLGHFKCMNDIAADDVAASIKNFL